ncbi:MAG: folate family ECF transporter S component [Lachnospiraceae bacterium]
MKNNVKALINVSLLVAIEVILSRFCSVSTPVVKVGFGFVPIAICAIMYGPVCGGIAGGLADLVGAVLFPIGPFFPGFTVSAALTGIIFGLFLYKRRDTNWQLVGAVAINCIVISLFLSTYWISVLYGSPYWGLFPTRIIQNLIMIPIQFLVLKMLQKPVGYFIKKQYV